jgi:hypothetical protein
MITHAFVQVLALTQAAPWHPSLFGGVIIAYLGPQTVLPIASALAAAIGFILMFWRYIASTARKALRAMFKHESPDAAAKSDMPEETGS